MNLYHTSWSFPRSMHHIELSYFSWKVSLEVGFDYLVRLHFCEYESQITESGQREFSILMNNYVAEISADVIKWSGRNSKPVYKDYAVTMQAGEQEEQKGDLIITLQSKGKFMDPLLNGLEIFKLSNRANSLYSQSTMNTPRVLKTWISIPQMFIDAFGLGNFIVSIVMAILVLLGTLAYIVRQLFKVHVIPMPPTSITDFGRCFSLHEIQMATENFNRELIIGKGGFGVIYRGFLKKEEVNVAVKQLSFMSRQGDNEFRAEIDTVSILQHVNIISLIGYCNEEGDMILIYEYMENGSLENFLRRHDISPYWEQRLIICIGAARGLQYLHTGTENAIVHRDIKPSNILLDADLVPKISDFGMAKQLKTSESDSGTFTGIKGTKGYRDPEYSLSGKVTLKSDVYSFGVVLLEALCGRRAIEKHLDEDKRVLSEWAICQVEGRNTEEIIAQNLKGIILPDCLDTFIVNAIKCLKRHPENRPTMSEVVSTLELALDLQQRGISSCSQNLETYLA